MFKSKLLSGCLAFTVLISSTAAFAAKPQFIDIDASYAKAHIIDLYEQGIMGGVSDERFAPDEEINRKEFALVIAKTWGIQPVVPDNPTFVDLDISQYEYGYVEALVQLGILVGGGDSRFNGDQLISRQDAAAILYRGLANDNYINSSAMEHIYQDSSNISPYAQKAVFFAYENGLMMGNGTMFLPKRFLSRAETAVIAHRALSRGNLVGQYFWGVSPKVLELKVGEQKEIQILSQKDLLAFTNVFGLDNPDIGTVSPKGIFTAVKPGSGLITVNVGNRYHDIEVRVYE